MKRSISFVLHVVVLSMLLACSAVAAGAQIKVDPERRLAVATGSNLYCAGFIQTSAISTANKIIGAHDEADRWYFARNDYMFINMGRDKGVNVGDVFAVVRPRAEVKSKWSSKSDLGFYVQEVGAVEVVEVKPTVSVARIKASCDAFKLGDLVQLSDVRVSPMSMKPKVGLDRFADATGKPSGRILMARDGAELLTRDYIAYVDLGADDHVQVGDKLNIFRRLEDGNITKLPNGELASGRDYGFQSRSEEHTSELQSH